MSRWTDLIPRQEYTSQQRTPRRAAPSMFIVHTADGYYEGTISWQKGPNSVSSHFINGKKLGEVAQMVDTGDEAWTQSAANRYAISSENAGFGDQGEPLTEWQLEINAQLYARAHREYPDTLPLKLMASPDDAGLGWHGMGGDAWGGHYDCPGEVIKAQLPLILARATEIVNGDTDMALASSPQEDPHGTALIWRVLDGILNLEEVYDNHVNDKAETSKFAVAMNGLVRDVAQLKIGGVDIAALAEALRPVIRDEIDKTRLGPQ